MGPLAVEVVVAVELVLLDALDVTVVVDPLPELEADVVVPDPPDPTLVVIVPLSTYTPEK